MAKTQDGKAFKEPSLARAYHLRFVGDWGGANFHRICSWLTQEFCDRAGVGSRTSILSLRDGGMDSLKQVESGEVDLCISTPASILQFAADGRGIFADKLPHLRALATLPQNDRMVLAINPKYNIKTFEELRAKKPQLRIVTSRNDGTNFIGYVAEAFLVAHKVPVHELESWGAKVLTATRPEQCTAMIESGEADALLQEAIMTPWWRNLIEENVLVPLPAEKEALIELQSSTGLGQNRLPAGFWNNLKEDLPALDFSDFVILVRDDMPEEVANLLTWCLVETRSMIEAQYKHLPPTKSPLSYPLEPLKMAKTPIALHPGAHRYYREAGYTS